MADVLITPASGKVEFKDGSNNIDGKIELDGSGNLNITAPGGDLVLGDTTSDIFIGNGVNNIDIVFEQSGEIRPTSGRTLTIGDTVGTLKLESDSPIDVNKEFKITNQGGINHVAPGIASGNTVANQLRSSWTAGNDRWYMYPIKDGTSNFGRELTYYFDRDQWAIEGPLEVSSLCSLGASFFQSNLTVRGNLSISSTFTANTGIFTNGLTVNGEDVVSEAIFANGTITGQQGLTGSSFIVYDSSKSGVFHKDVSGAATSPVGPLDAEIVDDQVFKMVGNVSHIEGHVTGGTTLTLDFSNSKNIEVTGQTASGGRLDIRANSVTSDEILAGSITAGSLTVLALDYVNPVTKNRNLRGWGGQDEATGSATVSAYITYDDTERAMKIANHVGGANRVGHVAVRSDTWEVDHNKIYRIALDFKSVSGAATTDFYVGIAGFPVATEGVNDDTGGVVSGNHTFYGYKGDTRDTEVTSANSNVYFYLDQNYITQSSYKSLIFYFIGANRSVDDCPQHLDPDNNTSLSQYFPFIKSRRNSASAEHVAIRLLQWESGSAQNAETFIKNISVQEVGTGQIIADNIVAGAITASRIATESLSAGNIAAGTITASRISTESISAGNIAAGTITASRIATDSISAGNIAAGTITATEIDAGTITASRIATESISAGNIAAGTITASRIATESISAGNIAAGTITASRISTNSLSAGNIASGTITASRIAANSLSAGNIAAGTITADEIAAGTITGDKLVIGDVTNLVRNARFADERNEWTLGDEVTDATWGTALRLVGNGADIQDSRQVDPKIPVVPGEKYYCEIYLRTDTGITNVSDGIGFGFFEYQEDGTSLGASPYRRTNLNPTDYIGSTWTKEQFVFTTNSDAYYIVPWVTLRETVSGSAYYTNYVIRKQTGTVLLEDGAITTDKIEVGAITASKIATDSISAGNIASGTITASRIATNSLSAGNIAADAITASEIGAGAVTTDKLTAGVPFPYEGLAYHWPLDANSSGSSFTNAVYEVITGAYSEIQGTQAGNAEFVTESPTGKAYRNVLNRGIELLTDAEADALESATGNGFAWSFWFKSEETTGTSQARILTRDLSDGWGLAINQTASSQALTFYGEPGTEAIGSVDVDTWHHIAFSENGSGTITIFLDGDNVGTEAYTPVVSERPVSLGCNTETVLNTGSEVFRGLLSDVRAYNRALSQAEVRAIYNAVGVAAEIHGDMIVSGTITADQVAASSITGTEISSATTITAGTGNNVGVLDGADATYRIYAGHATATSAPFRVTQSGGLTATNATITGNVTATSGTIGGFTIDSSELRSGNNDTRVHIGTDAIFLGANTSGSAPFAVTNAGVLTATNATINGNVTASSGHIGGFTIDSSELRSGNDDTRVHIGTDVIFLGANTSGSAPFAVTNAGVLTATNAAITGAITANSGTIGGFSINSTELTAGSDTTRMHIGPDKIFMGGVTSASAPFSVTNEGALIASNATITGAITANSGTIGGFSINSTELTAGSDTTRVHIGPDKIFMGGVTSASAPFSVTNEGALIASNATITGAITATSGSFTGNVTTDTLSASGGTIGGFTITRSSLFSGASQTNTGYSSDGINLRQNGYISTPTFYVTGTGEAFFKGTLEAPGGTIGAFTITSSSLYTGTQNQGGGYSANGITIRSNGVFSTPNFYIGSGGNAYFRGALEAASGTFSGALTVQSISAGNIVSGTITASRIATESISAGNIAAGTITASRIATESISAGNIAAGTITASRISTNSLSAGNIAAGTITASEIDAGTITASRIATESISAGNIAAGTITASRISTESISAGNIAAGTITASRISTNSLSAGNIAANAITASELQISQSSGQNSIFFDGANNQIVIKDQTSTVRVIIGKLT